MLASALLGEAGVDVYSLYDSFADVVFSRSVNDTFLKAPEPASEAAPKSEPSQIVDKCFFVEKLAGDIDALMNEFRRIVGFFNRFPDVPKEKWPLLRKALECLDPVEATRDVSIYRLFIRIALLKAYLGSELVGDSEFGTRSWACRLDLGHLRDNLAWITETLTLGIEDFGQTFPKRQTSLVEVQALTTALTQKFQELDQVVCQARLR
ncbi:hypothetical protein WDW86_22525 [Bdellovibrionota bacterium FG-2]